MELPIILLKAKRNSLHPWIYNRMIRHPNRGLSPGTLVEVRSKEGEFIGRGIYNRKSNIGIRLLTENKDDLLNHEFFLKKIEQAKELRESVLKIHRVSDCYRLVHSETDGLSGLIIDKYAHVIIVEPYSAGYIRIMDLIVELVRSLYPDCRVAVRIDKKIATKEGVANTAIAPKYPAPDFVEIKENQLKMKVNFKTGHKTGFFLDQRENRFFLSQFCQEKEILDCFCYTGGFAISAMLAGAKSATGIDLDENALDMAKENAGLNSVNINFYHVDVFDYLRKIKTEGKQADIIILDPAKLAGCTAEIKRAHKTYGDLNLLGMQAVRPGGIILTCSCSGLVSERDFLSILNRSAAMAGVMLQIFKLTGASSDHPFSTIFPEGRYLKAVFARVLPIEKNS